MKEVTHKILAEIAIQKGTGKKIRDYLYPIVEASVEPDKINIERIANDIFNALTVPLEWLVNHGVKARDLATRSIMEAKEAFENDDNQWSRYLGWAFHFIADWATPHHSPFSRSSALPEFLGAGVLIGGLLGALSKLGEGTDEVLKGIAKGVAIGGGITGTAGLVNLAIQHNEFEKLCDERITKAKSLVEKRFKKNKQKFHADIIFREKLSCFRTLMNDLRKKCNRLPGDWIYTSNIQTFAEYMGEIIVVMDFAVQIVIG